MKKLSQPQTAMLLRLSNCAPLAEESPGGGMGRLGKTLASAWHRTAHSLKNLGLVRIERFGDHFCVRLTDVGRERLKLEIRRASARDQAAGLDGAP